MSVYALQFLSSGDCCGAGPLGAWSSGVRHGHAGVELNACRAVVINCHQKTKSIPGVLTVHSLLLKPQSHIGRSQNKLRGAELAQSPAHGAWVTRAAQGRVSADVVGRGFGGEHIGEPCRWARQDIHGHRRSRLSVRRLSWAY